MRAIAWSWLLAGILFGLVDSCIPSIAAAGQEPLESIQCLSIIGVSRSPAAGTYGLTDTDIREATVAALKARAPRISINRSDPDCDALSVNLMFQEERGDSGAPIGYAATALIQFWRPVVVISTEGVQKASVWQQGFITNGPRTGVRAEILKGIEGLVVKFVSAYYDAGNP